MISGKMSTDSKAEYSLQTSATTSIKHIEHVQVKVNRICAEIVITPGLPYSPEFSGPSYLHIIWERAHHVQRQILGSVFIGQPCKDC